MKVVYVDEVKQIPAIGRYLDQLTADHTMPAGGGGERNLRVDVLGRYNFDRQLMPNGRLEGVDLSFRTVHGSKGLEADFVGVPNLTRGTHGFPSEIADVRCSTLSWPSQTTSRTRRSAASSTWPSREHAGRWCS